MTKWDHRVEVTTRDNKTQELTVSAKKARELEDEPFREGSNVARVKVIPPSK